MRILLTALKSDRKLYSLRMIRAAKAARIIRNLKSYRKDFWFISLLVVYSILFVILQSYFKSNTFDFVVPTSYFMAFAPLTAKRNPFGTDFWVEELGGDGSVVAAYLRVSTEKQVRGMSLEVQKDKIDKMKMELNPSRIYWFVDAGISGEDFDRRKLKKILEFREKGKVDELWVTHIDRIGRECRKSLLFFLQFTEANGIIRTPDRIFTTRDLADILIYAIESFGAEAENKRRAQRANDSKLKNFKSKKWNKPLPLGYVASGNWIEKITEYDQIIRDIFNTFISCNGNVAATARIINEKYEKIFGNSLKRDRLKHLLLDPVYIGSPTFMGVTIADDSLRYVDDYTFTKCQKLLNKNRKNIASRDLSTLAKLVDVYDVKLLDFLEHVVEFHHKGCGGIIVRNGRRVDGSVLQQVFKCTLCPAEFRIPTKSKLSELINPIQSTQKQSKLNNKLKRPRKPHQKNLLLVQKADQLTLFEYC